MKLRGITSSPHADKRARKRIGTRDVSGMFEEAKRSGIKPNQMKGELGRIIRRRMDLHRATCVIYKNFVFWYGGKDGVLITVYPLPPKYHKYTKAVEEK